MVYFDKFKRAKLFRHRTGIFLGIFPQKYVFKSAQTLIHCGYHFLISFFFNSTLKPFYSYLKNNYSSQCIHLNQQSQSTLQHHYQQAKLEVICKHIQIIISCHVICNSRTLFKPYFSLHFYIILIGTTFEVFALNTNLVQGNTHNDYLRYGKRILR